MKKIKTEKLAVAYCRVASLGEGASQALKNQIDNIMATAKAKGYEIIKIYTDLGKGGNTIEGRTGLISLMFDSHRGEWGTVIISCPEKLAREQKLFAEITRKLEKQGCKTIFANKTSLPFRISSPEFIRQTFADYERAVLSQRAKQAWIRRKKGLKKEIGQRVNRVIK